MTDQPTPEGTPITSGEPPPEELAPPTAPAPPAVTPAAGAWQVPPPAATVKGKRTALAMVAGILLLIGGVGGGLLGLLVTIGGTFLSSLDLREFNDIPGLNGANAGTLVGATFAIVGIIVIAYSVAYLLAGIGVLRNSNWARVLGIVVGIISGLIWLPAVANAGGGGGIFAIVVLAVHVYIVVVLLFFWRSKATA
ncbi:MAG TPA: hypothetical protein VMW94_10900 [Actinomycetes bacterium]|nr:hypothetical protein [Actinomycetes bacterium]